MTFLLEPPRLWSVLLFSRLLSGNANALSRPDLVQLSVTTVRGKFEISATQNSGVDNELELAAARFEDGIEILTNPSGARKTFTGVR